MELVRRAQAGDREAFEMLVERHAVEVYRLAAAIVGENEARDLAQETFIHAWTKVATLRDPHAFPFWLRRICVNRCRNWLRSSKRRVSASLDVDGNPAAALPDPSRDFQAGVEARVVLEPAFERLTADQRAVLALHYSIGYSISEVAEILGLPVGTAKSRLNTGLDMLRRAIGSSEREPAPEVAS